MACVISGGRGGNPDATCKLAEATARRYPAAWLRCHYAQKFAFSGAFIGKPTTPHTSRFVADVALRVRIDHLSCLRAPHQHGEKCPLCDICDSQVVPISLVYPFGRHFVANVACARERVISPPDLFLFIFIPVFLCSRAQATTATSSAECSPKSGMCRFLAVDRQRKSIRFAEMP